MLRLQAEVEDLKAANGALQKNFSKLQEYYSTLNREMQRIAKAYAIAGMDYARKDDLTIITKSIQEAESRREADKRLFLDKFEQLKKIIAETPPKVIQVPASRGSGSGRPRTADEPLGVTHTVAQGQTLYDIIAAYNDDLEKRGRKARVTLDQITAANPGLKPNLLKVGQKIFIPIVD